MWRPENGETTTLGDFSAPGRASDLVPTPIDVVWRVLTGSGEVLEVSGPKTGFLSKIRGQSGVFKAAGGCGGLPGCGGWAGCGVCKMLKNRLLASFRLLGGLATWFLRQSTWVGVY